MAGFTKICARSWVCVCVCGCGILLLRLTIEQCHRRPSAKHIASGLATTTVASCLSIVVDVFQKGMLLYMLQKPSKASQQLLLLIYMMRRRIGSARSRRCALYGLRVWD